MEFLKKWSRPVAPITATVENERATVMIPYKHLIYFDNDIPDFNS